MAGDFTALQRVSDLISDFVSVPIADDGKVFSKLIMLYHPDRASFHLGEINRLAEDNNFDRSLEMGVNVDY